MLYQELNAEVTAVLQVDEDLDFVTNFDNVNRYLMPFVDNLGLRELFYQALAIVTNATTRWTIVNWWRIVTAGPVQYCAAFILIDIHLRRSTQ